MVFFAICLVSVISLIGLGGAILFHNLIVTLGEKTSYKGPLALLGAVVIVAVLFSANIGMGLGRYGHFVDILFYLYLGLLLAWGIKGFYSPSQMLWPFPANTLFGLFIGVTCVFLIMLDVLRLVTGAFSA